ncbi:urease accessory protein UreD [Devosia epidermidihirudinis]|uniref:Urease accessory protein UreD n=1 Tax=Devosia epidermidihirudinis TaxID=1293439 RepID=A0A0F5QB71_9HYPH|nr:urease accessory protein UreD [Devosia epidermidihirudinis]KKC37244.1 urease accessory protein UreD [Devosia epidermidihirudinis]
MTFVAEKYSNVVGNDAGPVRMQRARGDGKISTKMRGDATRLATLYQDGCAKIRLPHTHSTSLEAVLINTAGGLTGGDEMHWLADLSDDGSLVLTTQACERIYRSIGGPARVRTKLSVGSNAHLDWLPQETILFAASQLDRRIDIDLATGASLTAVEAILLGRDAMGELALDARLRDNWRVRRNGRLIHAEATQLNGTRAERDGLSLLAGRRALATVLHIAPDADQCAAQLTRVRALLPRDGRIAASANGERLVVRALADSGLALRRLIVPILAELSGAGSLPRLWHL